MSQEDTKPVIAEDGQEMFSIPVEEEVFELSETMGHSKIWAMKVCILTL
jgi:hypothetical protein